MVSSKNRQTLNTIFKSPTSANIRWRDIERLLVALGGTVEEGSGSRVRITLNGRRIVVHRPHPNPDTDKGAVVTLRKFLLNAGVKKP